MSLLTNIKNTEKFKKLELKVADLTVKLAQLEKKFDEHASAKSGVHGLNAKAGVDKLDSFEETWKNRI